MRRRNTFMDLPHCVLVLFFYVFFYQLFTMCSKLLCSLFQEIICVMYELSFHYPWGREGLFTLFSMCEVTVQFEAPTSTQLQKGCTA